MKDKYEGCYIDTYKDHYAIFADSGEKLAEYDNHKEAKEDIAEWEAEVKNESYIPADTLATGYRFTVRETELLENAIKKHVEQEVNRGVNAMFDTDSEEFKKVGNELYDKSQWWDDMKLTMRIKKTPFPRKNGYTNGDFRPNQKWLMGAIECCKSARDCDYLLKDAYLSVAHDKKLIQNLKSVRDGNPNKYVNVKVVQKWLDNGVIPEKVEKHIEWFKENYIKGLQAKKKEFKKKLNEDHSEISNDPEMEKLLALAGCTIEDLDTINNEEDIELDDDNPIDANTSREIDAVMDESAAKSEIDKDFVPKEKIKLSSLRKIEITEELINKYKKEYSVLRHVRCKDTKYYICDGYMWMNKDNKLVCYVGSCEYTDDHTKWIVSLEILPEYKGHGLSKQILDFATKTMHCKYLSVNKDNKLAKSIYDKYGFKVYYTDDNMYYMTIDPKAKINESCEKKSKNSAALRDLLGESTPDLDFIMESIFMDIDH